MASSWPSWESCCIFGRRERSIVESANSSLNVKTVKLDEAFDAASVRTFGKTGHFSADTAVLEAVWGIVLGSYTGAEDVRFGVSTLGGLEKIQVPAHSIPLGLFDTVLVVSSCAHQGNGEDQDGARDGHGEETALDKQVLLRACVDVSDGGLALVYPSDIWHHTQATWMLQLFSKCITELVVNGQQLLKDLDIIPPMQVETIRSWNTKELENSSCNSTIPQIITDQAMAYPDAAAVCAWDGNFTYRQLDTLSSQLAWQLNSLGICPNRIVPFAFNKSKWTIVSMLGIMKAGGAAVALNPYFPFERLKHIVHITAARLLLVGRDLQGILSLSENGDSGDDIIEIVVEEQLFPPVPAPGRSSFLSSVLKPDDLAFVHTSGSTGKPKAVMIKHRSYIANAFSQQIASQVSRDSRVLQLASHSFDVILMEVITLLMAGACVCVPSEDGRMNNLAGAINELQVNWIGMTPTLAKILNPSDLPGLRTLTTWGETPTSEFVEAWIGASSVELINSYGPAEISVQATSHPFPRGTKNPNPYNIGKSIKAVNTWIVRMDNRELLAPIGTVGELALQGPTVARGYFDDPARSAASFRQGASWLAPTSDSRHQRVYYTGDLVRYLGDGSLEIHGRRDTQVKIRGFRIELGEIEHHTNLHLNEITKSHTHSTSYVEVIRPSYRPEQLILAAFVSQSDIKLHSNGSPLQHSSDGFRTEAASLQEYLSEILPSYSVPSLYVPLDYIPTSASGKVDCQRLRELAASLSETELANYSSHSHAMIQKPPSSPTEIMVAELWADILGIDFHKINLDTNFFWLGGNSILAMRLAVATRARGLSVTVAQILKTPCLADLTSLLER